MIRNPKRHNMKWCNITTSMNGTENSLKNELVSVYILKVGVF